MEKKWGKSEEKTEKKWRKVEKKWGKSGVFPSSTVKRDRPGHAFLVSAAFKKPNFSGSIIAYDRVPKTSKDKKLSSFHCETKTT